MNRHTGRAITGLEHLRQSVGDILSTPIGSRVMRREYGSLVPELLDHPDNDATRVRLNAAVAGALAAASGQRGRHRSKRAPWPGFECTTIQPPACLMAP